MQQDTSAKGRGVHDNIPVSGRIGGVPRAGNPPGRRPGGALAYAAAHGTISNLVLVFTALLLLAVLDWHYYTDSRDNEALIDRRGTERAESLASLLRDNVAATIAQADALHGIARLLTAARMQRDTEAELDLRRLLDPAKGFSGLGVVQVSGVSIDGALMWSSLSWNGASADLRDREHFQALIGNRTLDLYFSSPVVGHTSGQEVVQFARPMHDGAGMLRAITVVSLRSDILLRLCQDLSLTPEDSVSLVREDGTILMRRDMQHLGEKFPDWSPVEQLPPPGVSAPPEPGNMDKSLRYAVVRQVPGTPLFLRVAIGRAAQADALVGVTASLWRWNALLNATVFALAITVGLVLATQRRSARSQARAESLFESEAWFRGLFKDLADGVLVMESVDGGPFRIGFANAAASKILGAAPGTLNGQEWLKLIHPDDSAWVVHRAAIARSGESLPMSEYRVVRPDDAVIWLRISSSVTRMGGRVPRVRTVTTFHDITEEHERVAALAEARDRTDRVLNVIPGVFYQMTAERC